MNLVLEIKTQERKLCILKMIQECENCIVNAKYFLEEIKQSNSFMKEISLKNSENNISRYERIKEYLLTRYKN